MVRPGEPPGHVLPDDVWCWIVVIGNMLIGITSLGFFRTIPVFFHAIMAEYDVDYGALATISSLYTAGMALGCFFLSVLTRKFGRRPICIVAGLVLGGANVVSSFSDSFFVVQICTGFFSGIATGILNFTMIYSSSQYFVKHRAKATGISTLGIPLGPLILAPVTNRLIDAFGWRGALLILSGVLLHSSVAASLYRPVILLEPIRKKSFGRKASVDRKNSQISSTDDASNSAKPEENVSDNAYKDNVDHKRTARRSVSDDQASDTCQKGGFCNLVKRKIGAAVDFRLFMSISYDFGLLSSIFYYCGYVTTNTFLVPLARDYIGLDGFQASTILAMTGAAECLSKVVTGYLADFKRMNRCILLAAMAVMCSFTIVGMAQCRSYLSLSIIAFTYGLFVTAYMGIIVVIFCDIVGPHKIATAVGYQGGIYNSFLCPCLFLMGRLVDATGDVRRTFYTCAGLVSLAALCLLVIYWLQRRKKRCFEATVRFEN